MCDIKNIKVINAIEIKNEDKMCIKLKDLTPEEQKELKKQALEELKNEEKKQDENRKAYKLLVNENVPQLFKKLELQSKALSQTKLEIFNDVKELILFKKEVYDVKELQQSHTLTSKDGTQSIKLGYRVIDGWDDTHKAGVEKVNEFIATLITDKNTEKLVKTINRLLQKDSKGNLKSSRVLELANLAEDYNNNLLNDGIAIIRKSYQPVKSCYFIEAYKTVETGKVNIPLSISSVEFPEGTNINFI